MEVINLVGKRGVTEGMVSRMEDYLQMSSMFPIPSSFVHNSGFIKNGGIQVISYRL